MEKIGIAHTFIFCQMYVTQTSFPLVLIWLDSKQQIVNWLNIG